MAKGKYVKWLEPENLLLLRGWAQDGLTDEQIAKNIGVNRATLYDWKKRFPDLDDALKKGKEVSDYEVENALFKSATGYEYEEEVLSNAGKVEKVKRYAKPNVTAQIFWLKNRKPDQWREKQEVQHSGNMGHTVTDMTALSVEELKRLAKLDD